MKSSAKYTFIGALLFANIAHSGVFSSVQSAKPILGDANHFYGAIAEDQRFDADELAKVAESIHNDYGLFVAKYNNHSETYIGDYNIDKVKSSSQVVAYSALQFTKTADGHQLKYTNHRGDQTLFIDLGQKHREVIDGLFNDLQDRADFVAIDGAKNYGRGGAHLQARNLPPLSSLTLTCTSEIYSDKSGGNRCVTSAQEIDFSNPTVKVFAKGSERQEVVIPKKELKTWDQFFWNR